MDTTTPANNRPLATTRPTRHHAGRHPVPLRQRRRPPQHPSTAAGRRQRAGPRPRPRSRSRPRHRTPPRRQAVRRTPRHGMRRPKNPIPGRDFAGIVAEVGTGVNGYKPGDEVYGVAPGSFAEYAVTTPTSSLANPLTCPSPKPPSYLSPPDRPPGTHRRRPARTRPGRPHHGCLRRRRQLHRPARPRARSRSHRRLQPRQSRLRARHRRTPRPYLPARRLGRRRPTVGPHRRHRGQPHHPPDPARPRSRTARPCSSAAKTPVPFSA